MSVAFSGTDALLKEQAALVGRALDVAREVYGGDAAPGRVRVLAAVALARAGLLTSKAAARDCGVGNPVQLAPSQLAKANVSEADVAEAVRRLSHREPGPKTFKGGKREAPARATTLRRFASAEIDPEQAMDLRADHPAVIEGRTIFPNSVVGARLSPRLLVSGHNNPKLGKEVLKGDRAGWPIFHLTLEERATCPRSCPQWRGCYGNAMHLARRHRADDELMTVLRLEVVAVAKQYTGGFLVRLHTLGDFFSVEYVLMWAELLAAHPALHVFGYTARREDDEADPASQKIARAIAILTKAMWPRFAIRTSHAEVGAQRSVVFMKAAERPDVVMCPAQTKATEACGSCGLCWSIAAREKTIGFLNHGMKRGGRGRKATVCPDKPSNPVTVRAIQSVAAKALEALSTTAPPPATPAAAIAPRPASTASRDRGKVAEAQRQDEERLIHSIRQLASGAPTVTAPIRALAQASGIPQGSVLFVIRRLQDAGRLEVKSNRPAKGAPLPNTYRVLDHTPDRGAPTMPPAGPAPAAPEVGRPALAELPTLNAPQPPSRAIRRGALIEGRGDGVSRVKPISADVIRWSRAYLERGGVSVEYLADLFDVDAEALARAVGLESRAA